VGVVVDSNKQVLSSGTKYSSSDPILHYIVIQGIKEDGSGGTRYFYAHDPGDLAKALPKNN
jgi:hypothetical protein